MKCLLFCLSFVLIAIPLYAQQPESTDMKQLRELKEVMWPKAYREQDVHLLDQILDPRFQMIDAEGQWSSKQEELQQLPSYRWPHERFHYDIKRLEIFADDTAIIAGEGRATGTGKNGPYCLRYQSSNVLVKSGNQWRAISSHVSGVHTDCPFPAQSP
ncbi:nuclear transport factor 2 family protein [Permianibacter aggregans]|uniref:Uncharacterized protein DUF4440 n=1 Tax=Permianibacter aggregans TaxID=1510150 RepID=A0A4R6US51_9GAMM|nr:nuclear transport factor 2 family protein [Permianibacter aggregans]TDQ48463.1 uncharacterized protein DUF4440 [Permianibacter aggregans]